MKPYKVTITETLQMDVEIMAESRDEAQHVAEHHWKNADYILDADHFKGVEFNVKPAQKDRGHER
ncbi:DpnD/PcfM family protein [Clostridia bacterium OttesenSCG-928-F22]|nr:DpnD/PcfM family protein [Clostridia bacterium OttesenSCG-928-F22]